MSLLLLIGIFSHECLLYHILLLPIPFSAQHVAASTPSCAAPSSAPTIISALPSSPGTRRDSAHLLLLLVPRPPRTAPESPTTRTRAAATAASIAPFATSSPLGSPQVTAARTPAPPLPAPPSRILSAADGPVANSATRPSARRMLPGTAPISAAMASPPPSPALPSTSPLSVALIPTGAATPTSARPRLPGTPRPSAAVSPIKTRPAPGNLPPSSVETLAASTATLALPVRMKQHCYDVFFSSSSIFCLDIYKV